METEQKLSVKDVSIRYGLILGLILTIFSILVSVLGYAGNRTIGYAGYLLMILVVVQAHIYYKSEGNGFLSFGQGLGIGTLLGAIAGAINSLVMYIYVKFIDSSVLDAIKDLQLEEMEKQGLTQEQMDKAMEIGAVFTKPEVMYLIAFVGTIFMCFIFSLIITIFTRKEDPTTQI